MTEKLELSGKDFTLAVQQVMRFPAVGSFEGAGLIHMEVIGDALLVARQGIALSVATVPITSGSLKLMAVDEKQLSGFASICAEAARVIIDAGDEIKFRCRSRETVAPQTKGVKYRIPDIGKATTIDGELTLAERIKYLAALASEDETRPEVSCVLLRGDGRAAAISQRMMAVFEMSKDVPRAALPLQLAKVFEEGDKFEVGAELTILQSGVGSHCMPSPVKALKDFPVDLVDSYNKIQRQLVAVCRGEDLARVVSECDAVLGSLAKTAMVLTLTVKNGKIYATSENGAAKFRAVIACPGKVADGAILKLPVDELRNLSPFLTKELQIKLHSDKVSGASFMSLEAGSIAFPAYR